ncbi:cyclic-phosphate processing receiver domain-containing protein [Pseudomonas luteola]
MRLLMRNLGIFLDDERVPSDVTWIDYPTNIEWIVVRDYVGFTKAIEEHHSDSLLISFDHDLQDFDACGEERKGMHCIRWLGEYCMDNGLKMPTCLFHSKNIPGRENMQSYYLNAVKNINCQGDK